MKERYREGNSLLENCSPVTFVFLLRSKRISAGETGKPKESIATVSKYFLIKNYLTQNSSLRKIYIIN